MRRMRGIPAILPLSAGIPEHVRGLLRYLAKPDEMANDDLAIRFFRQLYPETFVKQQEAGGADGYVPGSFVLELKGKTSDWLAGLFQALAYKKKDLDFNQIVVVAKDFLALWQIDKLSAAIREDVLLQKGSPSEIGPRLARKYSHKRSEIRRLATWDGGAELSSTLFLSNPTEVSASIKSFEKSLAEGRKVRQKVTLSNFVSTLKEMREFFEPEHPVKTVRAFYSMVYSWNEGSTVVLSERVNDQATLGGEIIRSLVPSKRGQFKDFVEKRAIHLASDENRDDFFSMYDRALDAVDRNFRIKHGIYFTDLYLSKFVMWLVRRHLPDLGKDYLVIDPACGSGNLVTNWRSPLEIRHKVVSEIEPELLYAIDQRMRGDAWHHGRFTVVPRVTENCGLNFLDRSAQSYLDEIAAYLRDKNLAADKPLAFLCNPPYRNDDNQTADHAGYSIDPSIKELVGNDAEKERFCCFLAQMKLICETAVESGLPGDSLLLLFTKSSWLTRRSQFEKIRAEMLGCFEDIGGMLVDGGEFFQIKGSWPVAFTMWRYKGSDAGLNTSRPIPLRDLTWLRRNQLTSIPWNDPDEMEQACRKLYEDERNVRVRLGEDRASIREWSDETMVDFKRDRRKAERNQKRVGGLPAGDRRLAKKKAYGESAGSFIGFMDDLTPCRVKRSMVDKPWFRLNGQFMDIRKTRCFSGPPDNRGYCASDLTSAKKLFFWYALARTFVQYPYPMWVDSDDMWMPSIPTEIERQVYQTAFSIGFAENECLTATFPAGNPVADAPEIFVRNPMTPLDPNSFWSVTLLPHCRKGMTQGVRSLIESVDGMYETWRALFKKGKSELHVSPRPYLFESQGLTIGSGVVQILDYAREHEHTEILQRFAQVQADLKTVKKEFYDLVLADSKLNYFGRRGKLPIAAKSERRAGQRDLVLI